MSDHTDKVLPEDDISYESGLPVDRKTVYRLAQLIVIGMAVQLLVIGYVFYQSYQGRQDVVIHTRLGCERGKKDRKANAAGWRAAEQARTQAVVEQLDMSHADVVRLIQEKPRSTDIPDLIAARKYENIATELEERSQINCQTAFPKAGLLP